MEAAVSQRATEALVKEKKQESDLDAFGGEAIGIAPQITPRCVLGLIALSKY